MKLILCLIALSLPFSLIAAPKFPFPQAVTYQFGIKPASINNEKVQAAYKDFLDRFYEENGDKARIKWDDSTQTVSEGIGYGMLIMVYMDNATNNTQAKFDKLWKYYNSYLNKNGLMNWKISGFGGVSGQNAATDAEMDVAMALVQAYKQWGDEKYLNDAKVLIDKIWQFEVNANGYLKPGDSWDDKKNPSYFSTAALESFKHASSQDWNKVINNSYSLLQKCTNSNTGLMPDWCTEAGAALAAYGYDAVRTPWRIAWDYVWFGRSQAKSICSKIATWINTKTYGTPIAIVDGYSLDGNSTGSSLVSTFLGSFACAGMVDAAHQSWLNAAYSKQEEMVSRSENYFSSSLKMIYLLLLSGNMPDLWAVNPVPSKYKLSITQQPSTGGTVTVSPTGTEFTGGTEVTLTVKAASGYLFVNWSGDASGTDSVKKVTISKDMNISAVFSPKSAVRYQLSSILSTSISTKDFNTTKSIEITVPEAGSVALSLYDISGKQVVKVSKELSAPGMSSIPVLRKLGSGTYFVKLETSTGTVFNKLSVSTSGKNSKI